MATLYRAKFVHLRASSWLSVVDLGNSASWCIVGAHKGNNQCDLWVSDGLCGGAAVLAEVPFAANLSAVLVGLCGGVLASSPWANARFASDGPCINSHVDVDEA